MSTDGNNHKTLSSSDPEKNSNNDEMSRRMFLKATGTVVGTAMAMKLSGYAYAADIPATNSLFSVPAYSAPIRPPIPRAFGH